MPNERAARALERLIRESLGPRSFVVETMQGGASPREFRRVRFSDGETAVAMYHPEGETTHELAKVSRLAPRWAFVEVQELLSARGVRVPKILGADRPSGWLLVEDLGRTLAEHLLDHPEEREALYAEAVTELASAQKKLSGLPTDSVVGERAFDAELLGWEIEHFREWALEANGVVLDPSERAVFDTARDLIAETLASYPRGFVHRDYQSRNLMVCAKERPRLGWIDFQDALLGPKVYDLVALLGDSYQSFDRAFVERRLDEYSEATGTARRDLERAYLLTMVQRKLKDAGRFIYLKQRKGNAHFEQFFEATIQKAQAALARLAELEPALGSDLDGLARLLARHFGDLEPARPDRT